MRGSPHKIWMTMKSCWLALLGPHLDLWSERMSPYDCWAATENTTLSFWSTYWLAHFESQLGMNALAPAPSSPFVSTHCYSSSATLCAVRDSMLQPPQYSRSWSQQRRWRINIIGVYSPFFVTDKGRTFLDFAAFKVYNQGHVLSFNLTVEDLISRPSRIIKVLS